MIQIRTNAKQFADKYAALAKRMPISVDKMMSEIGELALAKAKDASGRFKSPGRKQLKKMGHPFAKRHVGTDGEGVKIVAVRRGRTGIIRALQSGKGSGLTKSGMSSFVSGANSYLPYPPEYIGRDYGSGGKSFAESWEWKPERRGSDRYAVIYNTKEAGNGAPLLATLIKGGGSMIPRRIDLLVKRLTLRDAFNKAAHLISGVYEYVSKRTGTRFAKTAEGTFFQSASGKTSVSWKK